MSRADVDECVLRPMQATFYPTRELSAAEMTAALATYGDVLEGFEAADLKAGWTAVAAKWDKAGYPKPNFILTEVKKARIARAPAVRDVAMSRYGRPSQTVLWQRWLDCRSSQLAADAVAAGVAWALKCAVLQDGVNPERIELDQLKLRKSGASVVRREIEEGAVIPYGGRMLKVEGDLRTMALRMWAELERNEERTAEEINRAWKVRGHGPAEPLDVFWNRQDRDGAQA